MYVTDIVFDTAIRDPHSANDRDMKVTRLTQQKGREFTIVEDGPWLHIHGKTRVVTVLRARVVDILGHHAEAPKNALKAAK